MILKKLFVPAFLIATAILHAHTLTAQEKLSSDELLVQARSAAFQQKDYPKAIALCQQALSQSPGYTDIRVFLGRLYFWSDKEDSSRITLDQALRENPSHEDAAVAAASIAYFTNRYKEGLAYCETGLQHHPRSPDLMLQKAKILTAMRDYKPAARLADSLLTIDPKNTEARALSGRIRDYAASNRIGISYDYTHFDKQFSDPWHLISLDYGRQTKYGSIIGRVNYTNRFKTDGVQFEVDAYPSIAKNFYAYVNFGYSADDVVFPKYRGGFSLYANLPKSFEADLGFRYLNFGNDTWIYTGSIGKYYKSFWFNLRAYVTPDDDRISHSYSFTTRYYLGGADDFLHLSLGYGISPDDRTQAIQLNNNYKLLTNRISGGYRFTHRKLNVFLINAGFARVEYLPKTKDNQFTAGIGYQRRF
ncbi:YaiO family outer membrane beta-barrel protein [Pseudobacter ginsenosidimutans]|uniref:YaiO family outer membrane protein n=1 Tax=Pseudobacter ginsenosidimutans TaxID=661488 RepID=A0A4Q7MWT6_9BACT|nr:YaiO family outer membrane beta-barrel protein [Pseudobacter ginsenosidimutans]QEC41571.1 YaiO family outer membrane beta-barrel protein [Pseudobacter ginsenosidimutans]RZS71643.1 YaiO family outer membrane protein [Pseudobacter ginsenosidimutans]